MHVLARDCETQCSGDDKNGFGRAEFFETKATGTARPGRSR
ncbi:hypothetical protein HMPREF3036_00438 [Sutterella sp. KLE1602]|nr:hypothetical protein HMPREF3036_00438 [Sutterella sp. KLE1602]